MNFVELDKLKKQIEVERIQLNKLLELHRPLLLKCETDEPDDIELSALAAMLHSFYTRIENIFKRMVITIDGNLSMDSMMWHQNLLNTVSSPGLTRNAIISLKLKEILLEYLNFRHVFRHAYSFELKWKKMNRLVLNSKAVLLQLLKEIDNFLVNFK